MKKFLGVVIGLAIIAAAVLLICYPDRIKEWLGASGSASAGSRRVSSEELGVSITVPGDWTSEVRSVGTPALIARGPAGEQVSVTFRRVQKETTAENFANDQLTAGEKKYRLEEAIAVKVGELDGWRLIAVEEGAGDAAARRFFYALPRGERMFSVICETSAADFEKKRELFGKIVASIDFEKLVRAPEEKP